MRAGPSGNNGLVVARGVFDAVKIEALMREHGAQVQEYKGKRLIVADHLGDPSTFGDATTPAPRTTDSTFALTFMEPGLVAFGSTCARAARH